MGARKNASVGEVAFEYAYSLFADKGIDGASLADIALSCGISKGTLYYYYPNKDILISRCAEACVKNIDNSLLNWVESLDDGTEPVKAFEDIAYIFSHEREDISLMLSLFGSTNPDIRLMMRAAMKKWQVMVEMGALRLSRRYAERLSRLSAAILHILIGAAAVGGSRDEAENALNALTDK